MLEPYLIEYFLCFITLWCVVDAGLSSLQLGKLETAALSNSEGNPDSVQKWLMN